MAILVFALFVASCRAERDLADLKNMFVSFKNEFGFDFGEHDATREAIFHENVRYIEETNAKSGKSDRDVFKFTGSLDDLPKSVDWREKGYVTAVKDQGHCGSCWAFSATGALEGLYKKMTGKLVSLSEQELVDCSGSFGNIGCNGGIIDEAFEYVKAKGLETEAAYPYLGKNQTCSSDSSKHVIEAGSIGFVDVPQYSVNSLKAALANNGPVSVAIEADMDMFQHYSAG
ncbi:hypothetical protein FOL47_002464, partial [Perkinsus chesapeaki]